MESSKSKTRSYSLIHEGWLEILRKAFDGFNNLVFSEQYHLADLIMRDGQSRYEHLQHEDGFSIPFQEIHERFGRTRFQEINNLLGIFEVTFWSHNNHHTRCYRLTEKSRQAKEDYYNFLKESESTGSLLFQNGKIVKSLSQAITSKDSEGNTAKNKNSHGVIDPLVRVKTGYLKQMIDCLEKLIK